MGVIEDVYEDLDTDVEFEEFEAAVHDKVEQMGGLADEETAAMLIAHELEDEEVSGVADIEPGMDEVKFLAKVVGVGDLRTFEREGDGDDDEEEVDEGRVINVEVADETGQVRISFWDRMAQSVADGELDVGDVLRIKGRPQEGYSGVEVSVDQAEVDEDADVDVQVQDTYRIDDLSLGLSDVNLQGRVLATDSVRTFDRDDGSEGRVANLTLGDETGRVRVTLWDEKADRAEELDSGTSVEVVDGYVRERDGDLELHVGSRGAVEEIDDDISYDPETDDISSLELGQTADLAGGVIETDPKRTFDRDDGSEGQVRNVRIKDETGDIRVALWGEKADLDIDLADYVVVTDAEIQEGWQDDLEASAGWRATVTVTDPPSDAPGTDASGSGDTANAGGVSGSGSPGLDAFGDEGASSADTATGGSSANATTADGETVQFTGTVVQAGNPVVLDDGTETRSVETDADLRLGEEVTVRGPIHDGRIDADEVY
ncbi:single-stranded DNA binding protein [Haloplanus aerogenes]|uniref:Replication factor A1 n=1 Tax=Haloplanus aerogenes TaxID=660522 RepID=A0A3M0CYG9_9EURY|nr:single-stranded DNA binding protein [Haloplanus aerogenes]AZH27054.1 single-stranded DNA binding protein [Haloplanus aerogenes]RMB13450.1 replication factor A1 [Haloplanus aerogenes]